MKLSSSGVHVSPAKTEVGGSFSIFIFLGDVPADLAQWLIDPAFAGIYNVFTDILDESANSDEQHRIITGIVHLNRWLSEKSGLPSLEENVVAPFLKRKG